MQKSVNFLELIGRGKVDEVLVGAWIVMGILLILGAIARMSLATSFDPVIPDPRPSIRSMSEALVEWLDNFTHEVTELHDYRPLIPFFGSLFTFILFANFLGLIPGMEPPTGDSDATFALGTVVFVYFLYQGFRTKGLWYLRSFLGPYLPIVVLMLPLEIADNLIRPFSLGLRLYANMFADHTVIGMFTGLWPHMIIPIAFYALGSVVCVIQALIFLVLAMAYVRLATGEEH